MNLDEIKDLLKAVNESGVEELEYSSGDEKIRIRRGGSDASPASAPPYIVFAGGQGSLPAAPAGPAPAAPAAPAEASASADGKSEADENQIIVTAPIVGTFYEAPSPNAPAFVEVGDRVSSGQVLCIIEAMKLMNEIEAETEGVVVKRFVSNGQPVEYGEALFALKKG